MKENKEKTKGFVYVPLRRPRRRSKRKKGRKERKLHSLRKNPTGTSICTRELLMKFVVAAFSLFTFASYDYDPILQTKAKVKETKQAV